MPAPLETQTVTGSHNQFWACPRINSYQTSLKSLIYKNHFGNYERVTLIKPVTFYHPITEFDDVAPRIASFIDGELAKEDIP